MSWVRVGDELPVEDDAGQRPEYDEHGVLRETEFIAYEPLEGLEIQVDDLASVADRRWLEATLDGLAMRRGLSTTAALDQENAMVECIKRFVKAARADGGARELEGRDAHAFLVENLEHEDRLAILFTLKRQCRLAKAKKKSWNSRFGSAT